MNKENYIKLIENHRQILEKSRNLIDKVFDNIADEIKTISASEAETQNIEKLEELSSVVNKLSTILLKVIAKEQEIALIDFDKLNEADLENAIDDTITEEDIQMMERFLDDRKRTEMKEEDIGIPVKT